MIYFSPLYFLIVITDMQEYTHFSVMILYPVVLPNSPTLSHVLFV